MVLVPIFRHCSLLIHFPVVAMKVQIKHIIFAVYRHPKFSELLNGFKKESYPTVSNAIFGCDCDTFGFGDNKSRFFGS